MAVSDPAPVTPPATPAPTSLLTAGGIIIGIAALHFGRDFFIPFALAILLAGAKPGARYNYQPAPPDIADRVTRIERVCSSHGVPLAAAAIQFPLGHARVASIIPGAVSPNEVARNRELMGCKIPAALWDDLKSEGLLLASAPVPRDVSR